MKPRVYKFFAIMSIAALVVACGGGGGGIAGIGGSGYIATGTVTGFGSIFVNGIKFETDSATFEVEDASSSQAALNIGMVVQVSGSINADGVTGSATKVRYGDQLQGPVASLSLPDADGRTRSFTVMGSNVLVDSVDTVFDGSGFSFDTIALNNEVEISGYYDENEILRATYIERKAISFDASSEVEVEGVIENLSNSNFKIRNVNVNAVSANLSDFEDGLQNGVYVEVKGIYNVSTNTITAREVEAEDLSFENDTELSIEGYITRYVSNSDFDINGLRINASAAEFEPATLQLKSGIQVEAEGEIVNGVFIADEIEAEDGDAEVHAYVLSTDPAANSLVLKVTDTPTVQTVTVTIDSSTTLEDDVAEIEPFKLIHVSAGDFVEVTGFESAVSTIMAIKLKRVNIEAPMDILLQGVATEGDENSPRTITVLGVQFDIAPDAVFQDELENPLGDAALNDLLSDIPLIKTPLVKLKDESGDSVVDEIDLE